MRIVIDEISVGNSPNSDGNYPMSIPFYDEEEYSSPQCRTYWLNVDDVKSLHRKLSDVIDELP